MKSSLLFLISFLFFLTINSPISASEEFYTKYAVYYQAKEDGHLDVIQEVNLTNKIADLYASKYTVSFPTRGIKNIRAYDLAGDLPTSVEVVEEMMVVGIEFRQPVVGLGKSFSFYLSYSLSDLVFKNGQIWEVFLPRLSSASKINEYQAVLVVPKSFGLPAYISPDPLKSQEEKENYQYTFSHNQLLSQGVRAAFGNFQIFDFVLNYHLENLRPEVNEEEIALPPDNAWQSVRYTAIDPVPLDVDNDKDGNWLAKYRLKAGQRLNVTATGKVKIFSEPNNKFFSNPGEDLNRLIKPDKYWEVDDPLIKAKAQELKTPREIYQFVVDYLTYDYEKVKEKPERLGAAAALRSPRRAICMEFTDLFIALARAVGIPAREVNGFAYTTDVRLKPLSLVLDILHAWPEYFDKKNGLWLPVDPTWEKTTGGINYFDKLDLNHFTFVIHGENSQTPYPAGSYRTSESLGKDVQVVFGKYEQEPIPKISLSFDLPSTIIPGFPPKGKMIIENLTGGAIYNLSLTLETTGLRLTSAPVGEISLLPPYGVEKIAIEVQPNKIISISPGQIIATANNQRFVYKMNIGLPFNRPLVLLLPGIILTGTLLIFVVKIKKRWSRT